MKKRLLAAVVILVGLTISSCSKTESFPKEQEQSRAHHVKGGHNSGGDTNSIPQVTGVTATVVDSTTIYLSWDSVTGATSYWIYRNDIVIAIVQDTFYTDRYASPDTYYTYQVSPVVNSVLGSTKSTPVTVKTPQ